VVPAVPRAGHRPVAAAGKKPASTWHDTINRLPLAARNDTPTGSETRSKGSDLSMHSVEHLAQVAAELNARPRKTLGWRTPADVLAELVRGAADTPPGTPKTAADVIPPCACDSD